MRAFNGQYNFSDYKDLAERIKISSGKLPIGNFYPVNIFGSNDDIGTSEEDIWQQGGTHTDPTVATEHFVSSSSGSDTNLNLTFEGLDASWRLQTVTIDFTSGQSQQTLGSGLTWIRIFKIFNSGSIPNVGDIYTAESDNLTGGVPDTQSKIRSRVVIDSQESNLVRYNIPLGYTGFLLDIQISSGYITTAKTASVKLRVREFGKVYRKQLGYNLIGNSIPKKYEYPLCFPEKTDIKVTANADVGGARVEVNMTLIIVANAYI